MRSTDTNAVTIEAVKPCGLKSVVKRERLLRVWREYRAPWSAGPEEDS